MSGVTDLSDFGVVLEAEEPKHDIEAISEAFGVERDALEINPHGEITGAFTFTAPLREIEVDSLFIPNEIAKIGYDVVRAGETAEHERFVTVRTETEESEAGRNVE